MADVLTSITPTTELEAVNVMLAAIGEAPLPSGTDLSTATASDVLLALQILRKSTRDVQTEKWRFNTEQGVEVLPSGLVAYGTSTLNVFKLPSGVLKWAQTSCTENQDLDLVERPSKVYTEGGEPVLILYDRGMNRDGIDKDAVYLDLTFVFNFTQLPETARNYIAVRSARQFASQAMGSTTLVSLTEQDEYAALRALKDDQGIVEQLNLFDTPESFDMQGRRPRNRARPGVRVNTSGTLSDVDDLTGGLF
jgi:hypothetical protein